MFKDSLKLISIRIIAHKYMLSAVFLGVILSSTITSTTIIYFDSLRDIALQSALNKSSPQKIDLLIVDSYKIGKKWEDSVRNYVNKIMVIDDLYTIIYNLYL